MRKINSSITVSCLECKKSFLTKQWRLNSGRGKFCSKRCQYNSRIGIPLIGSYKKGHTSYFKGTKGLREANKGSWKRGYMSPSPVHFKKGDTLGEKNVKWAGDNVRYRALHSFIERRLGKPLSCEHCGTNEAKKYEWANKSGLYTRDLNDWLRLCTKCHHKYDGIHERKNNVHI